MRIALAIVLVFAAAEAVGAHDGPHPPVESGASFWDAAALTMLAAAAVLYGAGVRRLRRSGAHIRPLEPLSFWAGWAVLVFALTPWMDTAAAWFFSAHMVQHELLMVVGAPLVIVGRPIVPWLWALPQRWRRVAGTAAWSQAVTSVWRRLAHPAVAWTLHGTAIWVWHVPFLYEAAVRSEAIHAVQHATFMITAVLFWWGLVYGRYGRAAYGASVLYVFTTMLHTGLLGALFAFSVTPFYDVYRERAALSGADAVSDQQLAGLYMWIPAGVVLTAFGLALLVAWISEAERRSAARRRMAAMLLAVGLAGAVGCGSIPHEADARRLTGGDPYRGQEQIRQYGCDSCHTIPGIMTADATVGPPLTQVARRMYLAGHIENTPENMMRWIEHPHAHDPKTAMPEMGVSPRDSRDIVAYLYTLR